MKVTLWKWMREHGVSPFRLCQLLGVRENNVYRWIRRDNTPDDEMGQRIRKVLEIPADVELDLSRKEKTNGRK